MRYLYKGLKTPLPMTFIVYYFFFTILRYIGSQEPKSFLWQIFDTWRPELLQPDWFCLGCVRAPSVKWTLKWHTPEQKKVRVQKSNEYAFHKATFYIKLYECCSEYPDKNRHLYLGRRNASRSCWNNQMEGLRGSYGVTKRKSMQAQYHHRGSKIYAKELADLRFIYEGREIEDGNSMDERELCSTMLCQGKT